MVDKITGLIGTVTVIVFVLGLAKGISDGFAGFWGGLPFWIIALGCLALTVYDYWDTCWRKK